MRAGALLRETWTLYRTSLGRLLAVAGLPLLAANLASAAGESVRLQSGSSSGRVAGAVALLIGYGLALAWVQAALVLAYFEDVTGRRRRSAADLLRASARYAVALFVAGVAAGIAVLLGVLLLVVPGLFLLTRWSLVYPAIALDRVPWYASFGRSWQLVRGRGWPVFLTLVAVFLVAAAAALVVFAGLLAFGSGFVGDWLGGTAFDLLLYPPLLAAATVIYARARADAPPPG